MDVLRRILLTCYGLLLLAVTGALLVWNSGSQDPLDAHIGEFRLQAQIGAASTENWGVVAIAAVAGILGLLSLVVALGGRHLRSDGSLRVRQADEGDVEVEPRSIEAWLSEELQGISGVEDVHARVRVNGGAVEPHVTVSVEPHANIARLTDAVRSVTVQSLHDGLGAATVRKPRIKIVESERKQRAPLDDRSRSTPSQQT